MKRYVFFFIVTISMANLIAYAGPEDDGYIRIARISYMEGHVSFQHTSDVDWTAATINLPLQPGDRIYTGPQGRAEIQFDEGSVLRLAESTDIQFLSLSEDLIQIRILTGLSSLTVASSITFEMDTPAAAFIVLRRGLYRFDTRDNGDTDAIVRKGELEVVSHRFVRRIMSGEQIFVTADENSSYNIARYSRRDAWDEWNDRRDADYIARTSRSHLPDTVYVGVSDLDRHGRWVTVESYGVAWVPYSVGVSWSPYSVGRWCYRPVWGWTWVSYEPWGWLPYHYGRWYRSARFGWCWLPGPSFSFHFWSPGLVTFYYGPSWVSWCPLGPGDYYSINNYYYNYRLHHHHLASLRGLHRRAVGRSINRHARGAFRTVEINHFRNGGSRAIDGRNAYRKIDQPWNRGTLVRERLAVKPTSRSFSADPDKQVVRSKLTNPRRAVVHNTPRAEAATRDGYVRVTNPEVTSRAVARLRNGSVSRSADTGRKSDTGQARVLKNTQSKSVGSAKTRSAGSTVSGNQTGRRIVNSNDSGRNQDTHSSVDSREDRSEVRTYSRDTSSGRNNRSETVRPAVPRNSSETSSGRNSSTQSKTRSSTQSSPSVTRIQSTPQKSSSTTKERVRTNRSSSQPNVSRSPGSNNRTRTYSAPSSSSRTRTYSTPSSSSRSYSTPSSSTSRSRTYSAPSSSSRTPSYSSPSSNSRTRTYSTPSSSSRSRTQSYSSPSSSSRSRSYSAPSSSSRSRTYSAPSSSRSSSTRSSSPSSSGRSSSSSSSSSARQAKRR